MNNKDIETILREFVDLILRREFEKLYNKDILKRIKPELIEDAIHEYPGKLTRPPDYAYNCFDVFDIENNKSEKEINVDFFLWFDEEKSDLMLQLKLIEGKAGLRYGIWDIYVP